MSSASGKRLNGQRKIDFLFAQQNPHLAQKHQKPTIFRLLGERIEEATFGQFELPHFLINDGEVGHYLGKTAGMYGNRLFKTRDGLGEKPRICI